MKPSHEEYSSSEAYADTPGEHLVEGFDPEVALDLGIPVDDASLAAHIEAGAAVRAATRTDKEIQALIDVAEHEAVNQAEGTVGCANCNNPGCLGCGRS